MEKEQLKKEIAELEDLIKPKKERLREIYRREELRIGERLKLAQKGLGDFTLEELRFAANYRCSCGAGFSYPKGTSVMDGQWECSDILRGLAQKGSSHSPAMPFMFYDLKSEDQPSANGQTTRPQQ